MMQKTCRNAGLFLWADGGAGTGVGMTGGMCIRSLWGWHDRSSYVSGVCGVGMTGDHVYPESVGLA